MKGSILTILFLICINVLGQSPLDFTLDGTEEGRSLDSLFKKYEIQNGVRIFFRREWLKSITIQKSYRNRSFIYMLDEVLPTHNLQYIVIDSVTVVVLKDSKKDFVRQSTLESARRENRQIRHEVFGDESTTRLPTVRMSGLVLHKTSKQPLSGVNIQVADQAGGTSTDFEGAFDVTLIPGAHLIIFSFLNYETTLLDASIYENASITIELEDSPTMLDEVVIEYNPIRELSTTRPGLTQLTISELKRLPSLMGESDVIRKVQHTAGVTTVGEGASGFNVRGGSVDQNLILYDGLPVFNSNHVFGFFSAFNAEAIRDISFYKGGIPAEYGGRIASVLAIKTKDGDFNKWNGNAGVGMLTSNFSINGPLRKGKTSIAASARSTYSNWLIRSVRTDYTDLSKSAVSFYDGTLKLSHLGNRTQLGVSAYASSDQFTLVGDTSYRWNSQLLSTVLNYKFSGSLTGEFGAGVSRYGYRVTNNDYRTASRLAFNLFSTVVRAGFQLAQGNHRLHFGWNATYYAISPGSLSPDSPESNAASVSLQKQNAVENAFYLTDEIASSDRLSLEAGIRLSIFTTFGPQRVFNYGPGPKETLNITDTLYFSRLEPVKTYVRLEPRLSIRVMTGSASSIKISYNRMSQFLHLVTNTTAVTPVDIWQPSGYHFKPQTSDQVSTGFYYNTANQNYGWTIEGFYKWMNNITDFKEGAQLILNDHIETALLQGTGVAYGVETQFSRSAGRFTGELNYTFSRSFRTIRGESSAESVNQGKRYASNFDQPHVVNMSWKYSLSKRHYFTGNFTFHSGRPVTVPLSVFNFEETTISYFSERNEFRLPDYHRLDLAFVVEPGHKRQRLFRGTWVFSIYNVYARRNAYTIFFRDSGQGIPQAYQLSIIGTALPSVSYNIKF